MSYKSYYMKSVVGLLSRISGYEVVRINVNKNMKNMYTTKEESDGLVISFGDSGNDFNPSKETIARWEEQEKKDAVENYYLENRFSEKVEIFRYSFTEKCGWLFSGNKKYEGDRVIFNVYNYDGKLMFKAFEKSFHYIKTYKYFKDSRLLVDIAMII